MITIRDGAALGALALFYAMVGAWADILTSLP